MCSLWIYDYMHDLYTFFKYTEYPALHGSCLDDLVLKHCRTNLCRIQTCRYQAALKKNALSQARKQPATHVYAEAKFIDQCPTGQGVEPSPWIGGVPDFHLGLLSHKTETSTYSDDLLVM